KTRPRWPLPAARRHRPPIPSCSQLSFVPSSVLRPARARFEDNTQPRMDRSTKRMDRSTKLIVFTSNLVAVWLLARLASGGLASILAPAAVAFAVSCVCALVAGDIAVTIVLSLMYFV